MVRRIILAIGEGAPLVKQAKRVCTEVSQITGVEVDIIKDDWEFLYEHGERDEWGGIDLPQIFIETDEGEIKHVMTRLPLTPDGKVDLESAKRILLEALRGESNLS